MSNNKQSMKLYTEEQVRLIIRRAQILGLDDNFLFDEDYLIEQSESIELPSDEEIEKEAPFSSSTFGFEQGQYQGFLLGAKWIKDKILNK